MKGIGKRWGDYETVTYHSSRIDQSQKQNYELYFPEAKCKDLLNCKHSRALNVADSGVGWGVRLTPLQMLSKLQEDQVCPATPVTYRCQ